jgi:hypothetical protein
MALAFIALLFTSSTTPSKPAQAACIQCCCIICTPLAEAMLHASISLDGVLQKLWMTQIFFNNYILKAMMMMTDQLVANAFTQLQIVGAYLDASHQMQTQRLFQQLQAQAHKDYHPSEGLCTFVSVSRALGASSSRADFTARALSSHSLGRRLNSGKSAGSSGAGADLLDRSTAWKQKFCDASDNNNGGLTDACAGSAASADMKDADVNYGKIIESPLTLAVDFLDGTATPQESAVLAMQKNLYSSKTMSPMGATTFNNANSDTEGRYLDTRALAARYSVAESSFNAIVGMKAQGSGGSSAFVRGVLKELQVPDQDILDILGRNESGGAVNPSYFAQMEVLAKKIYQHPDFYINLYDTPANVARKGVAMEAIKVMQDRDSYRSHLRMESMLALLLEVEISKVGDAVQNRGRVLTGEGTDN